MRLGSWEFFIECSRVVGVKGMVAMVQGILQMGRKDLAELGICQAQSAPLLFHWLVSRDWSSSHGRPLLPVLLSLGVGNNLMPSFSLLLEMYLEAVFLCWDDWTIFSLLIFEEQVDKYSRMSVFSVWMGLRTGLRLLYPLLSKCWLRAQQKHVLDLIILNHKKNVSGETNISIL